MNFDQCFDVLLDPAHEGGYSFHPSDPGGETMYGVTARVARANGYMGNMRDLPREKAKEIYRRLYWDPVNGNQLPEKVRYHVFDMAVNSGVPQASFTLQKTVGVAVDGHVGPLTIKAAGAMGQLEVVLLFSAIRLEFLTSLPTWAAFGKGWARRIATNMQLAARKETS